MGSIIQNAANNFTTNGVITASGVNNTSVSAVTSLPSGLGGSLTLISSQTASGASSVNFTSGIDSTYRTYLFKYINVNADSYTNRDLKFNGSTNGGSSYSISKTTTVFRAYHTSSETADVTYRTNSDTATGTAGQPLNYETANDASLGTSGYLYIFNPSSTTYIKHFLARSEGVMTSQNNTVDFFLGGYFNTTSAINAFTFEVDGDTFSGQFLLYGIA